MKPCSFPGFKSQHSHLFPWQVTIPRPHLQRVTRRAPAPGVTVCWVGGGPARGKHSVNLAASPVCA